MRNRRATRARANLALTSLLSVMIGGCATSLGPQTAATPIDAPATGAPSKPKSVRIAMLLPLGGFDQTATLAKAMKQAGEMAIFEADNPAIQLTVKDDKGTADGARAAAEAAIKEGAEIIVGPLNARAVPGAANAARAANIPVIAFSNDPSVAGRGVYLMSFLVQPEVERVVAYAAAQGRKRFAALIPDDDYGRAIEPSFRQAVAKAGGTVADVRRYPPGANGLLAPAKEVFAAVQDSEGSTTPIDALFLPGGQDVLPHLGPQIAYSGVNTQKVRLLGTGAWDYPNLGRDTAFVGGWFAGPDPAGWRQFSERFSKTFGSAPPRIATLAYDAVGAAVSMASGQQGQPKFAASAVTRPSGFIGVDGTVRFADSGLSNRSLAILEVQAFGSTVIDPASSASAAPTKLVYSPPQ